MKDIQVSPYRKWVVFLLCLFLFPIGGHAFYVRRYRRGLFYCVSFLGTTLYYLYVVFKIHQLFQHILFLKKLKPFSIFLMIIIGGGIFEHIPFLDWVKYLSTYLIYLFIIGIVFWIYDLFCILCGTFRDSELRRIISKKI